MAVSSPASGSIRSLADDRPSQVPVTEARPSGSVFRGQRRWRWLELKPLPDGRGSETGESVASELVAGELVVSASVAGASVAGVSVAGVLVAGELAASLSVAGVSVAGELVAGESVAGGSVAGESVAGELVVAPGRSVSRSRRTQGGQAAVEYVVA